MFMNLRHAKTVYSNFNGRYGDPVLLDYFFRKGISQWYLDMPSYSYVWIAMVAGGLAMAVSLRHLYFNPDVGFRRAEQRRNVVDRWQRNMYAAPYFNHRLRSFALQFVPTLVDNEPDYAATHDWGVRPERKFFYGRYPLFVSCPKYHIDDPLYAQTTHAAMEERYKAIGYYPDKADNSVDEE